MIGQQRISKQDKTDNERWQTLKQRKKLTGKIFYYAVRTTGVFCRPGCGSRLPKRENVIFFNTIESAKRAGYRACKRCHPESDSKEHHINTLLTVACRRLEQSDKPPLLKELAEEAGLSPRYFHRLFKDHLGITPKQYINSIRASRFRNQLTKTRTVTDAIYETGFSSSSRAHLCASDHLGMKPAEYKTGANKVNIDYAIVQACIGWVLVAASDRGICLVEMADERDSLYERLSSHFPKAELRAGNADFLKSVESVIQKIDLPGNSFDLPLDIQGTAFQQRVWQQLSRIPAGKTATYTEIAGKMGQLRAARAVANACAANKLAVLIPCHRVIRADGSLGGYRWGLERKSSLLLREGVSRDQIKIPKRDNQKTIKK